MSINAPVEASARSLAPSVADDSASSPITAPGPLPARAAPDGGKFPDGHYNQQPDDYRRTELSHEANHPVIGIALGSGASRGWSHVGVIDALSANGIRPAIICGTSVGAMVGASCAAGKLAELKAWVLESTRTDVLRFFEFPPTRGGFVDRQRFDEFLHGFVAPPDVDIESLGVEFLAVATDLDSGREIWLREGSLAHAVKASMAMPGLFPAVRHDGSWLVDGGLVNPVPVSACRALGADIVIGVNLNADIVGKRRRKSLAPAGDEPNGVLGSLRKQARQYSSTLFAGNNSDDTPPGLFYSIPSAINIFQDRITRSRLVGDPADVLLSPKVGHIGILEFQRAGEAMNIGERCVESALNDIRRALAS